MSTFFPRFRRKGLALMKLGKDDPAGTVAGREGTQGYTDGGRYA